MKQGKNSINFSDNFSKNIEVENKVIIDAYEDMRQGVITKQDYMMVLIEKLDPYIKSRIAAKHRTLGAEFQDLVAAGREAIIAASEKYDPYRAMPTSFFTVYIDAAMKEEVRPGISAHYAGVINMLDKVARENGYESCLDPELTFPKLCTLASSFIKKDIASKTIKEAITIKRYETVSLDTQIGDFMESPYLSPEDRFIKKEKTEQLNKMLESISALDLFILQQTFCEEMSSRKIVSMLNTSECKKKFNLHKNVDSNFVNKRKNLALRKLRFSDKNDYLNLSEHSDTLFTDVYEQATEDEIEDAISLSLIF